MKRIFGLIAAAALIATMQPAQAAKKKPVKTTLYMHGVHGQRERGWAS